MAAYPAPAPGKRLRVAHRGKCVPWIRLQRDPAPYGECVAKVGGKPLGTPRAVYDMVAPALMKEDQEVLLALYLDAKHQVRGISELARGARSSLTVEIQDIIRIGVIDGATSCVLVHNHPSHVALPSPEDVRFTLKLRDMSREFFGKTWLVDHVIIGYGQFYSFHDNDWQEGNKVEKAPVPAGVTRREAPAPAAVGEACESCGCTHPLGQHGKVSTERARIIGEILGVDWRRVSLEQFRKGLEVELEHADVTGGHPLMTGKIALAHLVEAPDYYTRLEKAGLEADPRAAEETVVAAYDAGAYATNTRDPKEVEAARKLGTATTPRQVYEIVAPMLAKESQEVFLVLPLDLRGQLLSRPVEVNRGQRDRVAIDPSDVLRPVVTHNAKGFVVVHVHPSGHARPSEADAKLTRAIEHATPVALGSEVKFLDHVVVATTGKRGEFYSFRENGLSEKGVVHKA